MDDWRIQDDDRVKEVDEATLRRRLRHGNLSGTELVRPPGADTWIALHDTPLFREEVAFTGDPWVAARRRTIRDFLGHFGVFAAVVAMLWLIQGSFPGYLMWWGIFVAIHAFGTIPAALQLVRGRPTTAREPVPPALPEAPPRSEFRAAFDKALGALRTQLEATPSEDAPDLDGLRHAALDLDERGRQIAALADPDAEAQLARERDEVDARIAAAGSERSGEALEAQRAALDTRLAVISEAKDMLARVHARQRTLLHELEALRAELLQASLREGPEAPEMAEQVERLRKEAAASNEVDEVLARARRARQGTSH